MKFPLSALVLTGAVLAASAGCCSAAAPKTTVKPKAHHAHHQTPAAPSAGMSQGLKTTTINGKVVRLKTMPSGVRYYDMKVGTGASPKAGQTVSVQYTGTLMNGTKFDSSYDHGGAPIDFPIGVGQVIKGWDYGVPSMKVGGKRRLVIPGNLAYGANSPTPAIPPNATLVFDIELVGIK